MENRKRPGDHARSLVVGVVALMMGPGIVALTPFGDFTAQAQFAPKPPSERPDYLHVKDTPLGPLWLNYIESVDAIERATRGDLQARSRKMKEYAATPIGDGDLQAVLNVATNALTGDKPDFPTFKIAIELARLREPMLDDGDLVRLASSILTMRPSDEDGWRYIDASGSALLYLSKSPTKGLQELLEACDPKFWQNQGIAFRGMTAQRMAYYMARAAVWSAVEFGTIGLVAEAMKKLRDEYQGVEFQTAETGIDARLTRGEYGQFKLILSQSEKNLQRRAAGQSTEWDYGLGGKGEM